jgi:hypothetical protein
MKTLAFLLHIVQVEKKNQSTDQPNYRHHEKNKI